MKISGGLFGLASLGVFCTATLSEAAEGGASSSPQASTASTPKKEISADRQKVLARLKLDFTSGRPLEQAVEEARKAGVSRQLIAELLLLSRVRSRSLVELAPLLHEVEQEILPNWRAEDSVAFEEKSQLRGVIFLARGLLAADAGDDGLFEDSMKQAFWLNPELSPMLGEEIKARRAIRSLASVVVPMDLKFDTSSGENATLGELARGQKALLLDFWATWCGPCMNAMPQLLKRAQELAPQQVRVVGINTEADQGGGLNEARKKAETVKKQKTIKFAWLIEPAGRPISKLLKIDSIPRAILITPEGKVLYDGHPEDPRLATAFQKIGIALHD